MPIGAEVDSSVCTGGVGPLAHCSGVRRIAHAVVRRVRTFLRGDRHGCSTLNESNWIESVTLRRDPGLPTRSGQWPLNSISDGVATYQS